MKYIFEVRVIPPYTVAEYAEAWIEASRIIQQTPGALGTELHRKIGSDDTLLAIAHWQSKAHRDAKDDGRDARVRSILERHARTCEIRLIGEFEAPEWRVMPPGDDDVGG
ncbi:antibiotic biosynthesis monooxygenase [Flagellatimonas centrodinii]|uniref:antibiotic biosynthesis monooxygenase family protein n=1 Tax=Flagellatimonas centrodinii TaxID=2806210 RepID=UPI001FEDFCEC|nr:antibiotic biosynthesis monooxygenase [Flagellatimonas centrodinii]ULQ48058.1 antibiotic biosynthesis monooxygenase [Flagellatimonas centrodinii]